MKRPRWVPLSYAFVENFTNTTSDTDTQCERHSTHSARERGRESSSIDEQTANEFMIFNQYLRARRKSKRNEKKSKGRMNIQRTSEYTT